MGAGQVHAAARNAAAVAGSLLAAGVKACLRFRQVIGHARIDPRAGLILVVFSHLSSSKS
jgi:hypothetical protein